MRHFEIKISLYNSSIGNKVMYNITSDYDIPLMTDNIDLVIERINDLLDIGIRIVK